jgi:hypothetical protein
MWLFASAPFFKWFLVSTISIKLFFCNEFLQNKFVRVALLFVSFYFVIF